MQPAIVTQGFFFSRWSVMDEAEIARTDQDVQWLKQLEKQIQTAPVLPYGLRRL